MKIKIALALLFILGSTLSCGEKEKKDSGLTIEVSSQAIVIPQSEVLDCNGNEVKADRFAFQSTTITWSKTDHNLTILFVKIEFRDENVSGGMYSKVLGDEDLDNLFQYSIAAGNVIVQNGAVPAAASATEPREITNRDTCRLNFGGLSITDPAINFTAQATITVQGISTDEDGEETPVRATAKAKVVYNLN